MPQQYCGGRAIDWVVSSSVTRPSRNVAVRSRNPERTLLEFGVEYLQNPVK